MQVKVRSHGVTEKRRKLLVAAADYFLREMIAEEHRAAVEVLRLFLDHHSSRDNLHGYQSNVNDLPGLYTISVCRDISVKKAVRIMAHEFIHLNQVLTGRLHVYNTGLRRGHELWHWEGVCFGTNPYRGHASQEEDRGELPWEAEAYDNQDRWASQFELSTRPTSSPVTESAIQKAD